PGEGRVARGDSHARLGAGTRRAGDAHHRHAHRPAAHETARPGGPAAARGDPHGEVARLHGRPRPAPARVAVMREWLRGKTGVLLAFAAIATLIAGGLGWVT